MRRILRPVVRHPVLAGFVALLAAHLVAGLLLPGPTLFADEAGYLGNARYLADAGPLWSMGRASFFHAGYSLVLLPAVALPGSPHVTWTAAMVTNAVLLSTVFPLLYAIGRRAFGAGRGPALAGAAAGALYPATLLQGTAAWAEALLLPLVALLVLAAHALARRPAGPVSPATVALGLTAGALYLTHPRTVPLVALAAGYAVLLAIRRVVTPLVAGLNLAFAALVVVGASLLHQRLRDARWVEVIGEPSAGRYLDALEPANLADTVAQLAGQGWYLLVGSLGLGVVGLLWLLQVTGRPTADAAQRARRFTAGFIVVAALGLLAVSVLSGWATVRRFDQAVYGRYNEALVPVLVAVGTAVIVSPARRRLPAGSRWGALPVLGGAALVTAILAVVAVQLAPAFATPTWSVRNVLAVGPLVGDAFGSTVGRATLAATVGMVAIGLLALRAPRATVVLVGVLFVAGAAVTYVREIRPTAVDTYDRWELPELVDRIGPPAVAGYDLARLEPFAFWGYPFWLADTEVIPYDSSGADDLPGTPVAGATAVVAPPGWAPAEALGGRLAALDARNGQALWILPGPEQDRLAAAGALLPDGWPAQLPAEAARSRLEVAGDGAPGGAVTVASGGAATVGLRLTHAGRGAPWPDTAAAGPSGAVTVGVVWEPLDGDTPVRQDRVALPRWMEPGDTVELAVPLRAIDEQGRGLPPGAYRVTIGPVQDGFAWFDDLGDDQLQLVVTVT
ncbi:MAG: hypothetical protein IPM45_14845 [Acidimicrobiales bacterium]|nr:hypothetical protein [Acidimicrobiales bacterium]